MLTVSLRRKCGAHLPPRQLQGRQKWHDPLRSIGSSRMTSPSETSLSLRRAQGYSSAFKGSQLNPVTSCRSTVRGLLTGGVPSNLKALRSAEPTTLTAAGMSRRISKCEPLLVVFEFEGDTKLASVRPAKQCAIDMRLAAD